MIEKGHCLFGIELEEKQKNHHKMNLGDTKTTQPITNRQKDLLQETDSDYKEEYLTLNILELLSCDLQMFVLTFLNISDLYHMSLSCRQGSLLVLGPEADEYVWKSMASHLGVGNVDDGSIRALVQQWKEHASHGSGAGNQIERENNGFQFSVVKSQSKDTDEEAFDETSWLEGHVTDEGFIVDERPPNMWRSLVYLNMIKWDPDSRTPDSDIQMHNDNKTILCVERVKWNTIRANKKLEMGMIHCWEYTLDDHDNGDFNTHRIFIGIERSTYAFTMAGFTNLIGIGSEGIGYSIGAHAIHRDKSYIPHSRSILHEKMFKFSTSDTIAIKFDLQNLDSSQTASMHLFKNDEYFHTIENIPTQEILYYPAISVVGRQKVSIRMKHSFMLKIPTTLTHK